MVIIEMQNTKQTILIRSGITPFESPSFEQILATNILGGNIGNLLYATSVYKTLYTSKDTKFKTIYDKFDITSQYVDEINQTCKYFIIPLADAIRSDFTENLKFYTHLIKQLKIPCHVIGMGIRAPYEPDKNLHYPFDNTVKEFISAVLDKSAVIGVRGQITADYLNRLGFKEDTHINIIGCPSMYLYADNLKIKNTKINSDTVSSYNTQIFNNFNFSKYLYKQSNNFKKCFLIPQDKAELLYIYNGKRLKNVKKFNSNIIEDMYLNNNCCFFNNAKSWLNFLNNIDFTYGTRLHGCIASLIKGNNVLFFPFDARQRELAEFHKIPSIPLHQVKNTDNIFDIINLVDFQSPEIVHKRNFENYVSFLTKNGINNIYSCPDSKKNSIYFDTKFNNIEILSPIKPYNIIEQNELKKRLSKTKFKHKIKILLNIKIKSIKSKLLSLFQP